MQVYSSLTLKENNMRKKLLPLSLVFAFTVSLVACKKGDDGPAGAQGPAGTAGPAGPQGVPGNANVIIYNFGPRTFSFSTNYILSNLSRGRVDSSMILVYYTPSTGSETGWYPCPGGGPDGAFETRYFIYQSAVSPSTYTLGLRTTTGTGANFTPSVTLSKLRVIIALASSILPGGRASQVVDYSNYNEVKKYFGLPD
jgi:hypothetical protein